LKSQTGEDWNRKYQVKAIERLNFAKFDLEWLMRKTDNKYDILFNSIRKGDIFSVKKFLTQ
jgi:hypothetical protein